MIIEDPIIEPYIIKASADSYDVCEKMISQSEKNKGKEYYQPHGYYTDFENALKKNVKLKAIEKEKVDMSSFIQAYRII
mgnify:FL=1